MGTEILDIPPSEREIMLEREIAERRRIPREPDTDDIPSAELEELEADVLGPEPLAAEPEVATTTSIDGSADGRSKGGAKAAFQAAAVTMGPSVMFDALLGASALGLAADALVRPSKTRFGGILRTAAAVGSLAAWGYLLGARPWLQTWGASERELRSSFPGDGIIPRPTSEATRAITIEAPASYIWPWLVQLGAGRGGFYSYDWLENLAGLDIHTADEILPQFQHLVVGDEIPFGGGTGVPVVRLEHERALVLGAAIDLDTGKPFMPTGEPAERFVSMTWAFLLRPIDDASTRLIARFRLEQRPRGIASAYYPLMIELPHFVMERRMLQDIRDRAERMYRNEPS